jgi:UDP-sulfoquinovose synthase
MDTLQCIYLSATQPARGGELRIFNQITETFSVNELADKVKRVGREIGYQVDVQNLENPRIEKEDHHYNPKFSGLLELGLNPHLLTDESLQTIFKMVEKYKDSINHHAIYRGVKWK